MKIKKFVIIFLIATILFSIANNVYGTYDPFKVANNFIDTGKGGSSVITSSRTKDAYKGFEELAGFLMGIGILTAVGVGMILGIKFVTSSSEGKAEVKKLLTPYIVGTIIVVGALTIWRISITILNV